MYRPGSGGFYGQIRHRHLLLLQRGRPLMQDCSELVAHPTGTLESIAVRTAVHTLTPPERHGSAPRREYCPGKRTVRSALPIPEATTPHHGSSSALTAAARLHLDEQGAVGAHGGGARTVEHQVLLIVLAAFIAIGLDPAVAFLAAG